MNAVKSGPDYEMWAAHAGLTPYEIACLLVGETPASRDHDHPPTFNQRPAGDHDKLVQLFHRILTPLRSHRQAGRFADCGIPSAIAPKEAVEFIATLFAERGWGTCVIEHPFYRAASASVPDIVALQLENTALREKLSLVNSYHPPMLDIVFEVIAELYACPEPGRLPKREVVLAWLKERHPDLTQNQRKSIYMVTQHPSRRAGRPLAKDRKVGAIITCHTIPTTAQGAAQHPINRSVVIN